MPSRIGYLIEGTGLNPGHVLAEMGQRLEIAGATALGMPSNTAHHYAPEIEATVSVPLLNMFELSVARAIRQLESGTSVGMLASPAVRLAGVFDAALKQAGFTSLWPDDTNQILGAIRMIKSDGPTLKARCILSDAADKLTARGARLLFVACSEFSLISDALSDAVPAIDTVDVLADAIHSHILPM